MAPGHGDKYRSTFGGLWLDRVDALEEIRRRAASGGIKDSDVDLLRHFHDHGWVVLPQAVPPEACDRLRADIERAWSEGDPRLAIFPPGSQEPGPLTRDAPTERMRVVDIYTWYESAREVLFSQTISRFLTILFETEPLLFQSLSFEQGSQQGMHQDTAYVVVSSPLELVASWIALEDVREGTGELMYYDRSHTLPEYRFSGEYKHWSPERDGRAQHEEWNRLIHENAARMGLQRLTFLPKQGDVFIWSADLAHGGSPVEDTAATRKSLVGHYCPNRVDPHYFSFRPDHREKIRWGPGFFASAHYDVTLSEDVGSGEEVVASTGAATGTPMLTRGRRRLERWRSGR